MPQTLRILHVASEMVPFVKTGGLADVIGALPRALRKLETEKVTADFIFLDPPYRMEEAYRTVLGQLSQSRILRSNSLVIAEHQKKFDPGEVFSTLYRYRKLQQGDAALSFYRKGE